MYQGRKLIKNHFLEAGRKIGPQLIVYNFPVAPHYSANKNNLRQVFISNYQNLKDHATIPKFDENQSLN